MPGSVTNKKLMSSAMDPNKAAQLVVLLQPAVKVDYAMAPPPRQECSAPQCQYLTPEGILTWEMLTTQLVNHSQDVHFNSSALNVCRKQVQLLKLCFTGKVRQPVQQEKVVTKQVDTAQLIQQVPGTQQPEYRHEQVVVEDHAAQPAQQEEVDD